MSSLHRLAHQRDVLAGPLGAARERDAERGELLGQPADADAEDEAAAGQPVEAGDLLREDERVVLRDQADAGAETDLLVTAAAALRATKGSSQSVVAGSAKSPCAE